MKVGIALLLLGLLWGILGAKSRYRRMILIVMLFLVMADPWLVMLAKYILIPHMPKLAQFSMVSVGGGVSVGLMDWFYFGLVVGAITGISNVGYGVACALMSFLFSIIGLWVVRHTGLYLPGTWFILLGGLTFLELTISGWKKYTPNPKKDEEKNQKEYRDEMLQLRISRKVAPYVGVIGMFVLLALTLAKV